MKSYECPEWFRDAKFGIFLHYGVNSVPGYNGHYARHMYWQEKPDVVKGTGWTPDTPDVYRHHVETYGHPSVFGYKDFIPMWKAEKFDADQLAVFFKSIGAKYVVPMAVHHDNFDNWDSKHHRWNAVDMGPKRDLIGEWEKACRKHDLFFGVSSHFNAGHEHVFFQGNADTKGPLKGIAYDTQDPRYTDFYFKRRPDRRKILPEFGKDFLKRHIDLIDSYTPDLLYFDGPLPYGEYGMKVGAHFLNTSHAKTGGKNNGVLNLKRGFPKGGATKDIEKGQADKLLPEPWQTDTTINPGWFYLGSIKKAAVVDGEKSDRNAHPAVAGDGLRMNAGQIIDNLIDIVSKNGNMLLNVGQKADGSIPQVYKDELKKVGAWITKNGEAIYGTRPWIIYGEGPTQIKTGFDTEPLSPWKAEDIRFTTKGKTLYTFLLDTPKDGKITIKSLSSKQTELGKISTITMVGDDSSLTYSRTEDGLSVTLPEGLAQDFAHVLKITLQ